MRSGRLLTVALTGAAMLTSAAPAQAQRWHGHHHGRHHHGRHHHGGGIDGGDVLLGALLVGGAVAVASAVDKGNDRYDAPPPPPPRPRDDDYSYDGAGYDGGGYYADGYGRDYRSAPDIYGNGDAYTSSRSARSSRAPVIARENDAVDACATAAEDRGRRYARLSHVQDITDVDHDGRGWYVQGTIELRDGYRDAPERERQFRCNVASGTAPDVRIEGADYAPR